MRYRERVAFQGPVEVRDPVGEVDYTYETIPALTDLMATRATVRFDERRTDRATPTDEILEFVIAGDHQDIADPMALVTVDGVFDVIRVAPTLGRRQTLVTARKVSL